jgi:cellulase (glycosyl hydrolase family 5)
MDDGGAVGTTDPMGATDAHPTDATGATDAMAAVDATGDGGAADGGAAKAGVVVGAGAAAQCTALCVTVKTPTSPSSPDWSWENGASCVLPNTLTGKNQPCTIGQPLPPPPPQPGVVILDNTTGVSSCVALCVNVTTPNSPSAPDWSYENNASCVLPNSVTGKNQMCTTGQPVPPPAPRPGIKLVLSGVDSSCVPVCAATTTPSSTSAPDWSYENNSPCVLKNSPTYAGKLACTAFGPAPTFVPAALTGTKVHNGFYTATGRLYDAYGHEFVIRGIANPHLWFDTAAQYLAYKDLPLIAGYGTNTIRAVWDTTTLAAGSAPDGGMVTDGGGVLVPAPASLLAEDLYGIVQQKMVPMIELHGASGLTDTASLMAMVNYYVRPEVKKVLTDFQDYLLVNIANEWSGPSTGTAAPFAYATTYELAYQQAISTLRQNGITHTLVIDAPGFGQIIANTTAPAATQIDNWFTAVQNLLAYDASLSPSHAANLLFSVHMYGFYPASDATNANVASVLNHAGVGTTIPLIVGEFGWTHSGTVVAWNYIMQQCVAKGIGYIGWSWFGNAAGTAVQALNIVQSWSGPLTSPWGAGLMTGANGIQATSQKASIFP